MPVDTTDTKRQIHVPDVRRMVDWIFRIMLALLVPIGFMFWHTTVEHDRALIAIQANRFTAQDGLAVWQAVERKMDRVEVERLLRAEIRTLEQRILDLERRRPEQ